MTVTYIYSQGPQCRKDSLHRTEGPKAYNVIIQSFESDIVNLIYFMLQSNS